ncbi:MAG: 6-phosphogluconolactonase [Gemmatimonadaceae bacterium]|nr:6-phosphogluconolactonase [Gemmatimonadaceae bacterium]
MTGLGARREVLVLPPEDFARDTATLLAGIIAGVTGESGRRCRIVLAGGRTPAVVYRELATRAAVRWDLVEAYIGDERCVPPDHADSNFRMIDEMLLSQVPIPPWQIHRLRGERGSAAAAAEYDALLAPLPEPKFDLVLSGVGADGHTNSLFPGDARITTEPHWAMPAVAPPAFAVAERVGLSLRALNSTRAQVVLCTGADKRDVRARILRGDPDAAELPAAMLSGTARTLWIVDPG